MSSRPNLWESKERVILEKTIDSNMPEENVTSNRDEFLDAAVDYQLLTTDAAAGILEHSVQNDIGFIDSAVQLAALSPHQIDAIDLLRNPGDFIPGYTLTGLLGCGAAGIVFKARHRELDRDVAIKTINLKSQIGTARPERQIGRQIGRRIEREAQSIAQMSHPGIVTAYESGFFQDRFCIIMEFVPGKDLSNFIANHPSPSEATVWQIARQVAVALAHANEHGIVHRDIKPGNLLIADHAGETTLGPGVPLIKVADFGLALLQDVSDESQITAAGTALGTPSYVAPEQLQDSRVDARSDIYSLGATIFHLLAGEIPFASFSQMRVIVSKSMGNNRWREKLPSVVSDPSRNLFLAMTEFEVSDRVQSYDELIERIDEVLRILNGESPVPTTSDRESHRGLSHHPIYLAIIAGFILIAAVIGVWFWQ